MKKFFAVIAVVLVAVLGWYCYRFYPQQLMPVGIPVEVETPEYEKYRNDCLHPCIRKMGDNSYCMIQSPYYGWNNKVENPILYHSDDFMTWGNGLLLAETPATGYNSDPNVFVDDSLVLAVWREWGTPLCNSLKKNPVVVGKLCNNYLQVIDNHIYIYI